MNLPNKLTILRILLVPVFMLIIVPIPQWIVDSSILGFISPQLTSINNFINNYGNYVAAMVFIIASSTDALDGYIARKTKQITNFLLIFKKKICFFFIIKKKKLNLIIIIFLAIFFFFF